MEIICKICGSKEAKKNGMVSGVQRYKCKNCGHQYIKTTERGKSAKEKLSALFLYNFGLSKNFIAKLLNVSAPTVGRWMDGFGRQKLLLEEDIKPTLTPMQYADLSKHFKREEEENPTPFHVCRAYYSSGFEVNLILKDTNIIKDDTGAAAGAFGDSILRGVVRDSEQNKYQIVKNNWTSSLPTAAVKACKNFAKHGSTLQEGEYTLDVHLSELGKSAYVFLMFGGNECNMDWDGISSDPDKDWKPKCSLEEFEERYTELINKIKKQQKIPVLFTLPPIDANKFFNYVSRTRNKRNILHFLGDDIQMMYRWHEMYNLAVFKIAKANDVRLVDITSRFLEQKHYSDLLCDDGIHPNEKGHALIARIIRESYNSIE